MDPSGPDGTGMVCQTIYTLNALTILLAYEKPEYAQVLERADLIVADGIGAVWAIRRLVGIKADRVAGIDLIFDLCRVCVKEQQGVFLLGGRRGVVARCAPKLQEVFPGLKIAGVHDGYWSPEEEPELVSRINRSQAGLLLVGLGQPAQEIFLDQYHHALQVRVAMGVGGSFDVLAGDLKRAPVWMRRAGLEWLYRFWQQPWRIWRLLRLLRFIWAVICMPGRKRT
jgi:N-acetylglucosaminyldiphosphoundecaprenol N-acetyl-beta-D-mannosaminyltransferase